MLLSFMLIALIAFGGLALTYLFARGEPLLWRLAAGIVIGTAVFGTVNFIIALFFGLNPLTVLVSIIVSLSPLFLMLKKDFHGRFRFDRHRAKEKLQGKSFSKISSFFYYVFFALLFLFFFERTMFVTAQGVFTGGSQNLGDLPFHLGAIFSFTDGNNFPPQNPSYAGARFSYPFIADFVTASFVKLGIDAKDAMIAQNVSWAFSLLVILERFCFRLLNDRLAARIAPALLFFSGGLGFLWFFGDYWQQGKSFFEFIWQLPKDYTISGDFRWGNSLVTLFLTQRSLLLGMPLTLIVLSKLWKLFAAENTEKYQEEINMDRQDRKIFSTFRFPLSFFIVGLIAGMLPLIHLHSLAVLFIVTAFLFLLQPKKWREWTAFGIGVSILAVPQLLWSMSGSATEAARFFEWRFGWDSGETSFVWFWFKNTGIFIPMIVAGVYLVLSHRRLKDDESLDTENNISESSRHSITLTHFYLAFVFLFLISNIAKLAPWEWDNIKILIYWFVGSIPFVALALASMWRKSTPVKIAAACCFVILIFSGALDVWRTVSGQIRTKVFDADAVTIGEMIKKRTPPGALFLNAPTYNSAVVLSGRQSLMRYPGHLGSHGIDYSARENDVKSIYSGGAAADQILRKYGIQYVLISPEERNTLRANEEFFKKYPVIFETGLYKVYKIQN